MSYGRKSIKKIKHNYVFYIFHQIAEKCRLLSQEPFIYQNNNEKSKNRT